MSAYVSKYSWRNGYSHKVSADVVGSVLEKIEKSDGMVTSKSFLDYSRPEDSETHSMFEWDDSVAAEKYRLSQSGKIINQLSVEVIYEESVPADISINVEEQVPAKRQFVSAFVNVERKSIKQSAVFMNVQEALRNEHTREMVLENAKSELESFKRKYGNLVELSEVIKAIDEFVDQSDSMDRAG